MNTANTWAISFGLSSPPTDSRRLTVVESETKKQRNLQKSDNKMLVNTKEGKKLRRGLFALLRAGMDDKEQIYDLLVYRGFVSKTSSKINNKIAKPEFIRYLGHAKLHLKIPRKTKAYMMVELLKAGKDVGEIAKELSVRRTYVRQHLISVGLIEKITRDAQKNTPPAWSKCSIK